jgi:membrane-bound lytic murein transglycosylase D
MSDRHLWIVLASAGLVCLLACAPRYTATVEPEPPQPAPDLRVLEATLARGSAEYEAGVDYFVQGRLDSAAFRLERAVTLLSRNLDWSEEDRLLSERRLLLYKCRYFLERIPEDVKKAAPSGEIEEIEIPTAGLPHVEIVRNGRVERWLEYFTGDGRGDLVRWMRRSGKYSPVVSRILQEEGLPPEILNLALIESGFNPNAHSRAHAVGMWQFIESTGRIYGLRVDWWIDERKDPVKSTRAAAHYLRDLYRALDSWPLALAAYNCGQGGVERAMQRAHSCDFWDLRLKRETSNYVPKFMAACLIMNDPAEYGFTLDPDVPLEYESIDVEPRTKLAAIAKSCGVPSSVIEELNPHVLQGCVPEGKSPYPVRVPAGKAAACRVALAEIPAGERLSDIQEVTLVKHRVRSGDTLSEIAERYHTSVREVARANGIRNSNRIRIGQVLTVPVRGYRMPVDNPGIHTVRRNETLSSIAALYRVSVKDLVKWNRLKSQHLIYAGQQLVVSGDFGPAEGAVVHRVEPGETLSDIAGAYGKSIQDLAAANDLGSGDLIFPEQKIKIPGEASNSPVKESIVYQVRTGDTVSQIAEKYGVSLASVLETNNLRARDRIFPGQNLVIAASGDGTPVGDVIVHEVTPGETVYSIARKYAASWKEVLRDNNLDEKDTIYPGQRLTIAAGGSSGGHVIIHTVVSGENVTLIARKYGVTVDRILDLNGLGRNQRIYPGQKMRIPTM